MKMPNFASVHHCGTGRLSSDSHVGSYFSADAQTAAMVSAANSVFFILFSFRWKCDSISCLYAAHQRNRAVLLLVVEKERTVRKPADKVIAPVLLDNPVLSHADIMPKTRLLYQFSVSISSDSSFPTSPSRAGLLPGPGRTE